MTRKTDSLSNKVGEAGEQASQRNPESGPVIREVLSLRREQTLVALRVNQLAKEIKLSTGIQWELVENRLRSNPDKIDILTRLVDRGGEPTVTTQLPDGAFRFDELSEEPAPCTPYQNPEQGEAMALSLGAELMKPDVYDSFQGKLILDMLTLSLLQTPSEDMLYEAYFGDAGISFKDFFGSHVTHSRIRCSVEV